MAESDGPSMSPQKKPKRESHFDSSWINEFNDIHSGCGLILISGCGVSLFSKSGGYVIGANTTGITMTSLNRHLV